ncbi:neutral alpha-glucosidase C isoform X2 [Amia ocellicauda]|uniref:neutral alpha-glucosidase C isoform X2 n=1 Tax=Amia ocellicauda TaxID=2972642 RepID=UPI003464D3E1
MEGLMSRGGEAPGTPDSVIPENEGKEKFKKYNHIAFYRLSAEKADKDTLRLSWSNGQYQMRITRSPFQLEVLCGGEVMVTLNSQGRLCFETLRDPPDKGSSQKGEQDDEDSAGLWKETFRQFIDIKANGPSSVGLDFTLHGFSNVYGIPEHADTLLLKDTSSGGPYRLYNLDVFAYDIHSKLGLYGSVPLLLAHKLERTIGIFWLNASETLLDISTVSENLVASPSLAKRRKLPSQTELHWMSESGIIDTFILLGPSPSDIFTQYAGLTGWQALPPLFSLGYNQCRWNYKDEADVRAVDQGFDRHHIPYDVIWLDIEHTQGKRYFTWDRQLFPDPPGLQCYLQDKKRKLVVISDPHIKIDPEYSLYAEAKNCGHFVKDREGNPYEGSCWPGPCCYLDFSNPKTRDWYSSKFALDNYEGSTDSLFVWNDMNEPSVFDGPEQTMPKDAVHYGGWEHRELHNLYGFYQHWATAEGLTWRSGGTERPFVLTRSFFAGSQRFGAVWTGDNVATWDYLKISIPMLLTLSITGISFCGVDVGGFFHDPEPELLVRWYQAGALQPFFRGHSAMQTKRREPWIFGEEVTTIIRAAISQRYCLLPYWYTLFHQAQLSAKPPMRPLWVEFPKEPQTFAVEDQYMIGSALLACPVTDPGVKEVKVLFPGCGEYWYDVHSSQIFRGGRTVNVSVTLDSAPVFQRGGTVVPRKKEAGTCTADQNSMPFSLTVALDPKGSAVGDLYMDDGHSFNYTDKKEFALQRFTFFNGKLLSSCSDNTGKFESRCSVECVQWMGVRERPSAVTAQLSGDRAENVPFTYEEKRSLLTVKGLKLGAVQNWQLEIK